MRVAALIVAAGRGRRFGGDLPKQYLQLDGRMVLRHSLATFAAHPMMHGVRTVIHPDDRALYAEAAEGLNLLDPVHGGVERQDSVRLGLESLEAMGFDAVLIHDGARPCVSRAVIDRVIDGLHAQSGAVPGLPVSDTLKRTRDGLVIATVPRDGLWRAQTPQGFRFGDILSAHRNARGQTLTDDAAVLEASGGSVMVVAGDPANIKITTRGDLAGVAEASRIWEPRTGYGFDVHGFATGDAVWLCGVRIPHDQRLAGHSDADVGLHALTDALYGAVSAGDIGRHFPPSEPRWKGAASEIFLAHARDLVQALGGRIIHVDVTLVCEAPKIGPHRREMIRTLARLLEIETERVSVKATTTEGLGFTGRREGIAAQAVATVMLPGRQPAPLNSD